MDREGFTDQRTSEPTARSSQFSMLAEAIAGVVIPIDGACVIEARALLDALAARVARAEAAFVAADQPAIDGAGSMATWLRHHIGLTETRARREGLRAERLAVWPGIAEHWERAGLTGAQVELAVALIPAVHVERFARTDVEVACALRQLSPHQTRIVLRHWVQRADAAAEAEAAALAAERGALETEPAPPERSLFLSRTLDDIAILDGRLHPDGAAVVEAALRVAERPDEPEESRTAAARRADALIALCGFYLDNHAGVDELGRQRPHLTVVVDLPHLFASTLRAAAVRNVSDLDRFLRTHDVAAGDGIWFSDAFARFIGSSSEPGSAGSVPVSAPASSAGSASASSWSGSSLSPSSSADPPWSSAAWSLSGARTLDGRPISSLAASVLTCDSLLERLLVADQRIIDHGRSVREFSPSQRRAVFARDQGCRFPGCALGPRHCQVHHLEPWQTEGRTDLSNAVALCSFHHHVVHRPRWRASLGSRGEFIVHRADGSTARGPSFESSAAMPPPAAMPPSVIPRASHPENFENIENIENIEELVRLARQRLRDLVTAA